MSRSPQVKQPAAMRPSHSKQVEELPRPHSGVCRDVLHDPVRKRDNAADVGFRRRTKSHVAAERAVGRNLGFDSRRKELRQFFARQCLGNARPVLCDRVRGDAHPVGVVWESCLVVDCVEPTSR